MTFGEKLLQARKEKGYTQEQLADLIGVAKSTYTGYEKGNREPDVFKIKKLIKILGVTSGWLLDIDENLDKRREFSEDEISLIKKYRALDERGKVTISTMLDREYAASARISEIAKDAVSTVKGIAALREAENEIAVGKK